MKGLEIHVPLEESFFLYVSNAFTSVSSQSCRGVISGLPIMLQSEFPKTKSVDA